MSLQIHNLSFFEIGQNESSELVLSKYPVIPSAQSLIEYEELVGVINRTINNKPVKALPNSMATVDLRPHLIHF